MNILGIITAVAIPSAMIGVSLAAWIIRTPFIECDCCGHLDHDHNGIWRCTTCDHRSTPFDIEAQH
jgi:hypothetical protein